MRKRIGARATLLPEIQSRDARPAEIRVVWGDEHTGHAWHGRALFLSRRRKAACRYQSRLALLTVADSTRPFGSTPVNPMPAANRSTLAVFSAGRPDFAAPKNNSPTTTAGMKTSDARPNWDSTPSSPSKRARCWCRAGIYHSLASTRSRSSSIAWIISRAEAWSNNPENVRSASPLSPFDARFPEMKQIGALAPACRGSASPLALRSRLECPS